MPARDIPPGVLDRGATFMRRTYELMFAAGDTRESLSLMLPGETIVGYSKDRGAVEHQVPERDDPDFAPGLLGRSFTYLHMLETLVVGQLRDADAPAIGFYDGDYSRPAEPEPELTEEEVARLESGDWIVQGWDTGGWPWGYIWYPDDPGRSHWHSASEIDAVMDPWAKGLLRAALGRHLAAAFEVAAVADRVVTTNPRAAALAVARSYHAQAEAKRVAALGEWLVDYYKALETVPLDVAT
jgi:hypothetical protein